MAFKSPLIITKSKHPMEIYSLFPINSWLWLWLLSGTCRKNLLNQVTWTWWVCIVDCMGVGVRGCIGPCKNNPSDFWSNSKLSWRPIDFQWWIWILITTVALSRIIYCFLLYNVVNLYSRPVCLILSLTNPIQEQKNNKYKTCWSFSALILFGKFSAQCNILWTPN